MPRRLEFCLLFCPPTIYFTISGLHHILLLVVAEKHHVFRTQDKLYYMLHSRRTGREAAIFSSRSVLLSYDTVFFLSQPLKKSVELDVSLVGYRQTFLILPPFLPPLDFFSTENLNPNQSLLLSKITSPCFLHVLFFFKKKCQPL